MIQVLTQRIPTSQASLPDIVIRTTQLRDSYMLWAGTTDSEHAEVEMVPAQGVLTRDWSCAMPPLNHDLSSAPATTLFRTSTSDASSGISQRLARRFKKQIFLSLDVPPAPVGSSDNAQLLLEVERALVQVLRSVEGQ